MGRRITTCYKLFLLCFILLNIISCDKATNECFQVKEVRANINFLLQTDSTYIPLDSFATSDTTVTIYRDTAIYPARMTTLNLERNAIFTSNGLGISFFLNPDNTTQQYLIQFDTLNLAIDTITIEYKTKLQFISNACGYTYYYDIIQFNSTNNIIDSITIINGEVTNDINRRHLQLYLFQ